LSSKKIRRRAGRVGNRDAAPCRRDGAKRVYPARPRHARPADEHAELDTKVQELACPRYPFR
jgi:hypothetical protein